ncbi:hypothetical protein HQ604_15580 [Rhodococcus corynebacterioides]|uniref:Lipoprotein n=1 Tax=Rhodococcoides corynebacterioides TaxID=53972 RepID=A0ABS7P4D8_9NOCA|nr:hypothetical protein [Rhodococcus corynebacterioides]MBY6409322.1 hypothetical protein [Rhodococcus corynebacterioides]
MTASALVLVSACGSDDDSASSEDVTPTTSAVTLPVSASTTTLVDAGAEPRSVLTREVSDEPQSVTLVTSSSIGQKIDAAESQDFSTPELTMPLEATASADGDTTTVSMTLGAVTSPDATLQAALPPTEGSTAGFTTSATGAVTALTIDPAPEARDIARSAVEQALSQAVYRAVPFPTEPIGVGARWTVTQQVVSGIALTQTTTATLRSIDDGVAQIDVEITQAPESPVWELPDNQGTLNIETFVMTGGGSLTVDTSRPLPVAGTVTVGGDQVYRDANSATSLSQTTANTITWR